MSEELTCPICGKKLNKVTDKQVIYLCEEDETHKFIIVDESYLWTPIIDIESEEDPIYFRKFIGNKEVFDENTTENLLGIIHSLNLTIKDMISEYNSLGEYTKACEAKIEAYKAASANSDVTLFGHKVVKGNPSGLILPR